MHFPLFDIPAATADRVRDFTDLLQDKSGAIWVGTGGGIYRILPDKSGAPVVSPKVRVESMIEDRAGQIWIGVGGFDTGLRLFAYSGDEPREIRVFGKKDGLNTGAWINALLETSDGRIFAGDGLCEYTPQADPSKPQFRVLSTEGVVALGEDTNGNIWFSTNSNGVRRITRNGFVNFDASDGFEQY